MDAGDVGRIDTGGGVDAAVDGTAELAGGAPRAGAEGEALLLAPLPRSLDRRSARLALETGTGGVPSVTFVSGSSASAWTTTFSTNTPSLDRVDESGPSSSSRAPSSRAIARADATGSRATGGTTRGFERIEPSKTTGDDGVGSATASRSISSDGATEGGAGVVA
jgi:hypothetical protein